MFAKNFLSPLDRQNGSSGCPNVAFSAPKIVPRATFPVRLLPLATSSAVDANPNWLQGRAAATADDVLL